MIQIMASEKRKNKLLKEKGLNLKKTIEYRKQNERLDDALQKQLCLKKVPRSSRGRPRKSFTDDGKSPKYDFGLICCMSGCKTDRSISLMHSILGCI